MAAEDQYIIIDVWSIRQSSFDQTDKYSLLTIQIEGDFFLVLSPHNFTPIIIICGFVRTKRAKIINL